MCIPAIRRLLISVLNHTIQIQTLCFLPDGNLKQLCMNGKLERE